MRDLGGLVALTAGVSWLSTSCGDDDTINKLIVGSPGDAGMSPEKLDDVFRRIEQRVAEGRFPGATALVARRGIVVGRRAFGVKEKGGSEPVTLDTLFDLESMTKVLATSTAAMVLIEKGSLKLTDAVATYLPDFAANGKEAVTVRDMLRYAAGLPVDNQVLDNPDDEAVWKLMAETPLEYPPGTKVEYSDLTYRLLGRLIEAVAGMNLDAFARNAIWQPLGMKNTMFNPGPERRSQCAATGFSAIRGEVVRGEVQDEQDFALGGIVGCDGVFSTVSDIAAFCQMFLNGGTYGDATILSSSLVAEMVKNQTPEVSEETTDLSPIENLLFTPKGYGWELFTSQFSSGGTRLTPSVSYGKAGGAGTFMWVDPARELFGILLTNHGLPVPFDGDGWASMLDNIGTAEFFDGIVDAVIE